VDAVPGGAGQWPEWGRYSRSGDQTSTIPSILQRRDAVALAIRFCNPKLLPPWSVSFPGPPCDPWAGEVLYPSQGLFYFKVADPLLMSAIFHAYNDWLAEFCRTDPPA